MGNIMIKFILVNLRNENVFVMVMEIGFLFIFFFKEVDWKDIFLNRIVSFDFDICLYFILFVYF